MSEFAKSLDVTTSGLQAQSQRLRLLAENISNADTAGYRRKTVSFETEMASLGEASTVRLGHVRLDPGDLESVFDPSHPLADETGRYDGSNVNLIIELADAREAQRSYEANLKLFEQARQMSSNLMDLLRR